MAALILSMIFIVHTFLAVACVSGSRYIQSARGDRQPTRLSSERLISENVYACTLSRTKAWSQLVSHCKPILFHLTFFRVMVSRAVHTTPAALQKKGKKGGGTSITYLTVHHLKV